MNPRTLSLVGLVAVATALTGCGGGDSTAATPGSPDNPLQAKRQVNLASRGNEGSSSTKQAPGYKSLVQRQSSHVRSSFTPCNLVTKAQAGAILGAAMREPFEAPQGPTCIYRTRNGKGFVSVAVQSTDIKKLTPRLRVRQRVAVSSRVGYCGTYGQPMLYVPLSGGRVLSISAQCAVAKRFALKAVPNL
jgi:hypothetical protein